MKKIVLAILVLFSCTSTERTVETLQAHGFTNIVTTGYAWGRCADSDGTCTGFEAISPSGKRVTGAVGCGRGCGKGCTLRLD